MQCKTILPFLALLAALDANAINCGKASTAIEIAICASESHLADDKKIGELFNNAKKVTKYPDNVVRSQLAWVASRNESCSEAQDIDACIAFNTQERIKSFSVADDSRKNLPFVRVLGKIYSKSEVGYVDYSFRYILFSPADTPQKIIFNNLIEGNFYPGNKPLNKLPKKTYDSDACNQNTLETDQYLQYFSEKYLAIHSGEVYMGCGGAHADHNAHNLHFDMAAGRQLIYPDIFNKKSLTPLIDSCIKQIAAQGGRPELEYRKIYAEGIKEYFAKLDPWWFSKNGATIEFSPYIAGSYSEGFIPCEFSEVEIFPYLTESFIQLLKSPGI